MLQKKSYRNSKIKPCGRFQKNECFLPQLVEIDENTGKNQNEDTSIFGIGHCELIISPIESNGDPSLYLTVWSAYQNEWHPFMSQIQAKV